ncbi:MAG: hypothetical protein FJ405_13895 [Verrucomicrobia bacterium]|nr:hypothetical protein [Verrucomicrobiota bacterium]
MSNNPQNPAERLWREYGAAFAALDDLTLARWMAQTLGQVQGKVWRASHPIIGLYRLLSQIGQDRHIWLKRLAAFPGAYSEAPCCRAPLLPMFTRDILEHGLICHHCGETAVAFADLPEDLRELSEPWARTYDAVHEVAHWDASQQAHHASYDEEFEKAARRAERLLGEARSSILPSFLDHYPAIIWEDHDECLEVRADDIG